MGSVEMEGTSARAARRAIGEAPKATNRAGPAALASDDLRTIANLRAALMEADYTVPGIRAALATSEELSSRPSDIPVHLRRLPPDRSLSTLIKLFVLGLAVDPDESRRALPTLDLVRLERLGVIERVEAGILAMLRLLPHENLILACDRRPDPDGAQLPADWVTGIDPPAVLLANLSVRRPVGSALDVGTGCGIQALLAAQHSKRVVAVDLNPRALSFVEFNARLNGIANIECRQGSLFEPVDGLTFDLIVCNPPYVISPDSEYVYRDAGLPADSFCNKVVHEAPGFLNEGGFAQVLVSWVTGLKDDWSTPLRGWTAGSGCDTWLLHYSTEDPLTHAAKWNRPFGQAGLAAYPKTLDRWLDYYRRSGIEAIAFGAILQRRRSGRPNWTRADELPAGPVRAASDHVQRVFVAQDYLCTLPDDQALLDGVFTVADGLRLEQTLACRQQAWDLQHSTLRLESGLCFVGGTDLFTARFLPLFNGRRPLREILQEAARAEELEGPDQEAFTAGALPIVRRLLELGFLLAPHSALGL